MRRKQYYVSNWKVGVLEIQKPSISGMYEGLWEKTRGKIGGHKGNTRQNGGT